MTAPALPQLINIDRGTGKITVDGEPFPFHVLADTITVVLNPDTGALQTVNLTIPAEHVTITDSAKRCTFAAGGSNHCTQPRGHAGNHTPAADDTKGETE